MTLLFCSARLQSLNYTFYFKLKNDIHLKLYSIVILANSSSNLTNTVQVVEL